MSWLYSIVIAGLMFTSEGEMSPLGQKVFRNQETSAVIRLDETERFEQTYPLSARGRVNVSNVNGSITVEAWDRNEVKLEAVKTADTRENLADVEIKIDARADSFSVEADYQNTHNRNGKGWKNTQKLEVQFRLTVPRTAVLDEIETVNGSVTVSDFVNYTHVSAVNGEVRATNLRGTAKLSTVNGTVDASFDRLETGSQISLETVNGRVNLQIPSDANATVKADTLNGSITNDFGLPVRKGEYIGRDLHGKIGTGDVKINLNSVNGGLSIARKNDGRTVNPATNLLQQKRGNTNDDNDDDDSREQSINTAKINREVAKAVAQSQRDAAKEAAKAAKNAQKELEKLGPELEKITREAVKVSVDAISDVDVVIDSEELKEQLKEAKILQREEMRRFTDANWFSGAPTVEKKSGTFGVKGVPKVSIDAKNCNVTVRGWDKSEVQYSVKKFSRRKAAPIDHTITSADSIINLKVNNPEGSEFSGENSVRVEVYVPKKSNLKITTDGEIRLEGVSGELELNGNDETINIRDSGGKLRIVAADALVRIVGFNGEVDTVSVDGETYLEGDFQKISARTVDGSIVLTMPENADFNVESNLKTIETGGFDFQTLANAKSNSRWKIGKGGANFLLFTTAEGRISVRGKNNLSAQK
jgi:hypothetical protein